MWGHGHLLSLVGNWFEDFPFRIMVTRFAIDLSGSSEHSPYPVPWDEPETEGLPAVNYFP